MSLAFCHRRRSGRPARGLALQYYVSLRYAKSIEIPQGLLASAYIAIALPEHSPIKKPLDRALIKITNSPEWRILEEKFFAR